MAERRSDRLRDKLYTSMVVESLRLLPQGKYIGMSLDEALRGRPNARDFDPDAVIDKLVKQGAFEVVE